MKVGISTACFYPHINTEDTLEIIKGLGFDICEVFLESDYETTPEFCRDLRDRAEKLDLEIHSVHPFPSTFEPFLFDRYPRRRSEMEEKFRTVCNAANILGAKCYVFHGLRKTGETVNTDEIAESMDKLCSMAEEYGIRIAWENVAWCRTGDPCYTGEVAGKMKKQIYFNLDIKQAVRSRHNPEDYIKIYKDRLINVHINDAGGNFSCLLPGEGSIDLGSIIKSVKHFNEDAPLIIEVYAENYDTLESLTRSRKYLENLE